MQIFQLTVIYSKANIKEYIDELLPYAVAIVEEIRMAAHKSDSFVGS
jgi:hypothetical protein